MNNCIVAQSGGPTSVINASIMGIISKNKEIKHYDNVYAGINGIEGILNENIVNLSNLSMEEINLIKYTPSSALGSCRYKLKPYEESNEEYEKLFKILDKYNIKSFFYAGGNDSMDTVYKLSKYGELHNKKTKFFGIPKTIDNDLLKMDHSPGFGSAAKLIATTVLENYLDSEIYTQKSVFILETMGRDTGWLAASAALAKIDSKQVADFIYLPEVIFSIEKFLDDVKNKLKNQNHVFIVVAEGIKNENGKFISEIFKESSIDKFGHIQLGGVCYYLKQLLLENSIVPKVRALEISTTQRCAMHCASQVDINESFNIGETALQYSIEGKSGSMIGIKRINNSPYISKCFVLDAANVANSTKYFPKEWINKEGNNVTQEAVNYISPLIMGQPKISVENGLPKYVKLSNLIAKSSKNKELRI